MVRIIATGLLAVLALGACDRHPPKLTPCIGDTPARPRIHDAGPPNCVKP